MPRILLVDDDPLRAFQRRSTLERRFPDVKRVVDAAEALCLVEQPLFADNLGLVISTPQKRGINGPAFVAELHTRMPELHILVLGGNGDAAGDYTCEHVRYIPEPTASEEMLTLAGEMLVEHEQLRIADRLTA